jgi:hypothetical protein
MTKHTLRLDETETHLSQTADDRSFWIIYTDDDVRIKQYHDIGAEFICDVGFGSEFRVPDSWVRIRPPKKLSKSHMEALQKGRRSQNT